MFSLALALTLTLTHGAFNLAVCRIKGDLSLACWAVLMCGLNKLQD